MVCRGSGELRRFLHVPSKGQNYMVVKYGVVGYFVSNELGVGKNVTFQKLM